MSDILFLFAILIFFLASRELIKLFQGLLES
jgi:hypothetical protein